MELTQVLYDVEDHIATITLNRPERMNAATFDLGEQLIEAFALAERDDDVRVVILTGAGRAFCAGDDVEGAWGNPRMAHIMRALASIRPPMTPESTTILGATKPLIAAVNGVALGIGIDMGVMSDLKVASEHARFGLFYVRMGVIADSPSYWRVPELIGYEKAAELLFTG